MTLFPLVKFSLGLLFATLGDLPRYASALFVFAASINASCRDFNSGFLGGGERACVERLPHAKAGRVVCIPAVDASNGGFSLARRHLPAIGGALSRACSHATCAARSLFHRFKSMRLLCSSRRLNQLG